MNSDETWRREQQLQQQRQLEEQRLRDQGLQEQQLRERQYQEQQLQEQRLRERQYQEQQLQEQRLRDEQHSKQEKKPPLNQEQINLKKEEESQSNEKAFERVLVLNKKGNVRWKQQPGAHHLGHIGHDLQSHPEKIRDIGENAFIRSYEQLHDFKQREQALDKHLQDFPGDRINQQELEQVQKKIGSLERITDRPEKWLSGSTSAISVNDLKEWKQEAETLQMRGSREKAHLERIEVIERRASVKLQSHTYLTKTEHNKMLEDRQEFRQLKEQTEDRNIIPDSLKAKVEAQREKYGTTEREQQKSKDIGIER